MKVILKKVQVGKDQEKAQSEKDSHSKNRGFALDKKKPTKNKEQTPLTLILDRQQICQPLHSENQQFGFPTRSDTNWSVHLALESILADCQHGFRSQRSCKTQLVQFYHYLVRGLNEIYEWFQFHVHTNRVGRLAKTFNLKLTLNHWS